MENTMHENWNYDERHDWLSPDLRYDGKDPAHELFRLVASTARKTKLCKNSLLDWARFVNQTGFAEPLDEASIAKTVDKALKWCGWEQEGKNWIWVHWDSDKSVLRAKKAGMLEKMLPKALDMLGFWFRDNKRFEKHEVSKHGEDWRPLHDEVIGSITHEVNTRLVSGLGITALSGKDLENAHAAHRLLWAIDPYESINWSKTVIRSVCGHIAQSSPMDPYLDLLEYVANPMGMEPTEGGVPWQATGWDGKPRVDAMFETVFSVAQDHKWVAQIASRNLMLGMVRRTMQPGSKHDESVILIGDEDIGKSSFCRAILLDQAYIKEGFKWDCSPQELVEQCRGMVLVEASEMDGLSWKVDGAVKTLLSQTEAYLRLSYRRDAEIYKFQHIIIGTSNSDEILPNTHRAGNRRFIPLEVGRNDKFVTEHLTEAYVKQLWAEAYYRVYFNDELALIRQEDKDRMLKHLQRYTAPTSADEAVYDYLDQRRGYKLSDKEISLDLAETLRGASPKAVRQIIKNTGLVEKKSRSGRNWNYWIKPGKPTNERKVVPLRDDDQQYLQEQGDKF